VILEADFTQHVLLPEEIITILKIIRDKEGMANLHSLIQLCAYIEKKTIQEEDKIGFVHRDEDLDLESVIISHLNLG